MFKPLQMLIDRVNQHGADSDSILFNELLYAGEFIVKVTTATMVALIQDDREGHRYRLLHSLVRSDGVGEWAAALDQSLSGPASQHLVQTALDMRRVFTERSVKDSWQQVAISNLFSVLSAIDCDAVPPADRPQLRTWFQLFAQLRNKTRGHGALTPAMASRLVEKLNYSIEMMANNNPIMNASWAYLHRNLSGKYRVIPLGGDQLPFESLKKSNWYFSRKLDPWNLYVFFRVQES